jgi:hypothetical protein
VDIDYYIQTNTRYLFFFYYCKISEAKFASRAAMSRYAAYRGLLQGKENQEMKSLNYLSLFLWWGLADFVDKNFV